jgi:hypothetical protein
MANAINRKAQEFINSLFVNFGRWSHLAICIYGGGVILDKKLSGVVLPGHVGYAEQIVAAQTKWYENSIFTISKINAPEVFHTLLNANSLQRLPK